MALSSNFFIEQVSTQKYHIARTIFNFSLKRLGILGDVWFGYSEDKSTLVGAAILWKYGEKARFWVQVIKSYRRQGVGTELIKTIIKQAQIKQLKELRVMKVLPLGEATAFLQALNFEIDYCLTTYETTLTKVLRIIEPYYYHLQKRNRLPINVDIVNLIVGKQRGLLIKATQLITQQLGGNPQGILKRLRGNSLNSYDSNQSLLLVDKNQVIGVGTCSYQEKVNAWLAETIVVHPDYRNSWSSVLLRYEWTKRTLATELTDSVHFEVRDDFTDTAKLAQRCQATIVDQKYMFLLNL